MPWYEQEVAAALLPAIPADRAADIKSIPIIPLCGLEKADQGFIADAQRFCLIQGIHLLSPRIVEKPSRIGSICGKEPIRNRRLVKQPLNLTCDSRNHGIVEDGSECCQEQGAKHNGNDDLNAIRDVKIAPFIGEGVHCPKAGGFDLDG